MAKIKHTKNEMKEQRESLNRFERFLPMLQLKKQQLQAEIQSIDNAIDAIHKKEADIYDNLQKWAKLFTKEPGLNEFISIEKVRTGTDNIAGLNIPSYEGVDMKKVELDLFATPPWFDDAIAVINKLTELQAEREILEEQQRLIAKELLTTSQRVNLFEKVKIPECRENIRVIRIFLGDQQTASVVRGKIAKNIIESAQPEGAKA